MKKRRRPEADLVATCRDLAAATGGQITLTASVGEAVRGAMDAGKKYINTRNISSDQENGR